MQFFRFKKNLVISEGKEGNIEVYENAHFLDWLYRERDEEEEIAL